MMRSFMSSFAAFAIKMSGFKKKVADPVKRDKYIEKLRKINEKPYNIPPYPYRSKIEKKVIDGVEVYVFNEGRKNKIIYIHGGAFCEQPRLPHIQFCDKISSNTDYELYFVVHKKAPNYTFETTFEFLESFYKSMLEDTSPENIVFMGDSSGGGMALSFCEYLNEINLPQPKRMILFSPWLDISMDNTFLPEFEKTDPSLQRDFLKAAGENWAGDTDVHDYRLSPINGDLTSLAPITLLVGTYEAFVVDSRRFCDLCKEAGAKLDYREYEGMNHVFVIYPIPEAKKTQKEIIDLLNSIA